ARSAACPRCRPSCARWGAPPRCSRSPVARCRAVAARRAASATPTTSAIPTTSVIPTRATRISALRTSATLTSAIPKAPTTPTAAAGPPGPTAAPATPASSHRRRAWPPRDPGQPPPALDRVAPAGDDRRRPRHVPGPFGPLAGDRRRGARDGLHPAASRRARDLLALHRARPGLCRDGPALLTDGADAAGQRRGRAPLCVAP